MAAARNFMGAARIFMTADRKSQGQGIPWPRPANPMAVAKNFKAAARNFMATARNFMPAARESHGRPHSLGHIEHTQVLIVKVHFDHA